MATKLELRLLKELYRRYSKTKERELWRATEAFSSLNISEGEDISPIHESKYFSTVLDGTHECYQINSRGINYGDNNFGVANHLSKNKQYYIPSAFVILAAVIGISPFISSKLTIQVSVADVQYELQDENGDIIQRKSWQDNSILEADERNISKMLVSIKLRNSSNSQAFSKIENYEEIFQSSYVTKEDGDFFDKKYSVPADGDSGFIFALDITPFTRVNPMLLSSSNRKLDIDFFDAKGEKLETAQINIADTYGITIPYKVGIYNNKEVLKNIINFNVLCRAKISNLKAVLTEQDNRVDLSKSITFECSPVF